MLLNQALQMLQFQSGLTKLSSKSNTTIKVKMKGESPEAHAEAILAHFRFTSNDEKRFQQSYGYNLRQSLADAYRKKDLKSAHKRLANGYFEVLIPLPNSLISKIKNIKKTAAASNSESNPSNGLGNGQTSSSPTSDLPTAPIQAPDDVTPSEKAFYNEINSLRSALVNFGQRAVQASDVRADYLKTIKLASDEFLELVKSGKISPEEGALRASKLRNFILDLSRGKDSELGRAFAESLKKEGLTFDSLLERYAQKKYGRAFSALAQAQKDAVFLEIVVASGRDRSSVSRLAPILGKAGKVCLVASIAISVYNVATAEDKVNAVGREGSSIVGGIVGGAAGGAAAGLICGPGAPVCSAIGIFIGGAVGAFVASGGYDWLTSK